MGQRIDYDPEEIGARAFYRLLTSLIVPRPIAWVSSLSREGVGNLAPHSFFTCSCTDPPVLQFTSVGRKDSQANIEATKEFVICFASEGMFEQINATGTNFPAELSEFEQVGLAREPSTVVAPPRLAESPAALECKLLDTISFGNSTVIFGKVVHAAIDPEVMDEAGDLPDVRKLLPMARLGRNQWTTLGEVRQINRIPWAEWPGGGGGS